MKKLLFIFALLLISCNPILKSEKEQLTPPDSTVVTTNDEVLYNTFVLDSSTGKFILVEQCIIPDSLQYNVE